MKDSTTFFQKLFLDLEYLKSLGAMNYSLEIGIYRKRRRRRTRTKSDDDDDDDDDDDLLADSLADGLANGGREGRCFEHVDGEHL